MITEWDVSRIPEYLRKSKSLMVMLVDLNGVVRYVNDTYLTTFGFEREKVLESIYTTQIYHGDEQTVLRAAERCLQIPGSIEKVLIRKPKIGDDVFYFSEWEFSCFSDEKGVPIGVLSVGIHTSDAFELKTAERDEFYNLINNMTAESWAFYDTDLRLKTCNKKAVEIAKRVFNLEPLRGDSALLFVEDNQRDLMRQAYLQALRGEKVQLELESKGGEIFMITIRPIYNDDGLLMGVCHYCLDVTHLRKSQEENKILSGRFQTLINQLNGIVVIMDQTGKIHYISDTLPEFSGFTKQQVLHRNFSEFIYHEDIPELIEGLKTLKEVHDTAVVAFRSLNANGSHNWTLGRGTVIEENGEKFILAVILNIDELKQKDELIEQHHMRFQQIAWLQSHEVRAPLARILGLADAIYEDLVESPEELRQFVQYIKRAAHELDDVIRRIVQMTHVQKPN